MQALKKNYDRVFALLVAVLTLAVSSMLIVKSFATSGRFEAAAVGPHGLSMPEIPDASGLAAQSVSALFWIVPKAQNSGKPLRAFASTTVFWVDGKLVDAFDGPPIRGNVPNVWLMENRLPIERDNVLSLDPDKDGFSNGEEFKNGPTDPNEFSSHPDALLKLTLADVVSEDFKLLFASAAGGKASIRKMGGGRGWFGVGAVLPGERHKLVGINGTQATIVDLATGKQTVLERRTKTNFPIHRAVFAYALDPKLMDGKVFASGEGFSIPRGGGECTVEALDLKSVTLSVKKADGRRMTLRLER